MESRYPWLWDTEMDNATFESILRGQESRPPHNNRWAMVRLVEYAPWAEIRRLLPRDSFLREWPTLAPHVRSRTRREGMNFFHEWLRSKSAQNG